MSARKLLRQLDNGTRIRHYSEVHAAGQESLWEEEARQPAGASVSRHGFGSVHFLDSSLEPQSLAVVVERCLWRRALYKMSAFAPRARLDEAIQRSIRACRMLATVENARANVESGSRACTHAYPDPLKRGLHPRIYGKCFFHFNGKNRQSHSPCSLCI